MITGTALSGAPFFLLRNTILGSYDAFFSVG